MSFLIVKNQSDLRLHYDLARDNGVDGPVLEQLLNGDKIPCLWQANSLNSNWENNLVAAHPLKGEDTYYYAYVQGPALFEVKEDRILSYHRHLEEVDAEELLLL